MRNLGILVSASLFAFVLACGSGGTPTGGSSGGTPTGGSGSNGGGTAGTTPAGGHSGGASGTTPTGGNCGTTTGTGGGNGSASCSLPDCLKYLATNCVETGTCATLTDLTTDDFNTCYPNGVTESAVLDNRTNVTTLTVKKGGSTCFSTVFEGNDVTNGLGASITVKNACGTTVATVRYDDALTYYLVTCTGAQEVATDPSCLAVYPTSTFMGSHCEEGACTP
jgi:hypothetical protein